jgi:hypothetical protein
MATLAARLCGQPLMHRTDKKFESHCRVPPHILSTGFNVWIPPSGLRSGPLRPARRLRIACPRDRGHEVRPGGRTSTWWEARTPTHHEVFRQRTKRTALAPSGPVPEAGGAAASLRWCRMRRQDMEKDRPACDGGDDPQGAFETWSLFSYRINDPTPFWWCPLVLPLPGESQTLCQALSSSLTPSEYPPRFLAD